MTRLAVGFIREKHTLPGRGERVAAWVEDYMRATGRTASEVAFLAKVDKRDLQRLLAQKSCGHRLEDDLAACFGWNFVESVMTPVIGADPISAREAELATKLAEAAAIHARLERERAARAAAPGRSDLAGAPALRGLASRRRGRSFDPRTPD